MNKRGEERAKCLATHFKNSGITNMYAYTDHPSTRSVDTLKPLSEAINVKIDTKTGRDDTKGLAKRISELPAGSVALICWEHQQIADIAEALGVHSPPDYNGYDEQWTVQGGDLSKGKEGC